MAVGWLLLNEWSIPVKPIKKAAKLAAFGE